jgi:hypothetical protein
MQSTYEREAAFFKFHPLSFVDDVINAGKNSICHAVDELEVQVSWKIDNCRKP